MENEKEHLELTKWRHRSDYRSSEARMIIMQGKPAYTNKDHRSEIGCNYQ